LAQAILQYATKLRFRPGDQLWAEGEPSDSLFIIEQGRVTVEQQMVQPGGGNLPEAAVGVTLAPAAASGQQRAAAGGGGGDVAAADRQLARGRSRDACRVFEFGPGCVAGAVDFYLHRSRSSTAAISSSSSSAAASTGGRGSSSGGSCRVLQLTREALGRMAVEAPAALHVLQAVVLRAKCMDLGTAAELAVAGRP
jgi:hypothetical protein